MREERGRERGQPASWQERGGEWHGPFLRSQSRTLGPLDDRAAGPPLSFLFDRLVVLLEPKLGKV